MQQEVGIYSLGSGQGGCGQLKITKRRDIKGRWLLLNQLKDQILTEGWPGWSDIKCGDEEFNWISVAGQGMGGKSL